jgi:hypothetical protein
LFERIRYEFALWRLQNERRQTLAWYADADSKSPKEPKNLEELQSRTDSELHDIRVIDDNIASLQTTFLREQTQRYLVPMPEFKTDATGDWEQAQFASHFQLKPAAIVELRSAIRKEKKERREIWQSWASLAIGVIGAMIGLIAILKK